MDDFDGHTKFLNFAVTFCPSLTNIYGNLSFQKTNDAGHDFEKVGTYNKVTFDFVDNLGEKSSMSTVADEYGNYCFYNVLQNVTGQIKANCMGYNARIDNVNFNDDNIYNMDLVATGPELDNYTVNDLKTAADIVSFQTESSEDKGFYNEFTDYINKGSV